MNFYMIPKEEDILIKKSYSVYMENNSHHHYICDLIDDDSEKAKEVNELGLTLRARLTRSKGAFAMLVGVVFDPFRLLRAACDITSHKTEEFVGGQYKNGYTLLTIIADRCTNKYLVFDKSQLESLLKKIKEKVGG